MKKSAINWIIGFLAFALVFTISLVIFYSDDDKYEYTGPGGTYQFIYTKSKGADVYFNYMTVKVRDKDYKVPLRSSPYDVEDIPLDLRVRDEILLHGYDSRWMKSKVLFTQKPELGNLTNQGSVLAVNQIALIVDQDGLFGLETEQGFSEVPFGNKNYDPITCEDATSTHSVVDIRYGEPGIYVESDNCVVVQANSKESMIKVGDKVVMTLVGVF